MSELKARPVVWIIDRQQWPRAYLRAELIERGLDAVSYMEIVHALRSLQHPTTAKPRVIVIELREQSLEQKTLEELRRTGLPVIVLGGTSELNEKMIKKFEWATVMRRPFTIGDVADRVEKLLKHPHL
jgi:hypothetical protein